MKRVYLALPTADAVAVAIRKRLKRKKSATRLKVVDEIESAQVVVTSTNDIGTLPEQLPESVELLQLIDCGGGQRYRDAPGLTISNASNLMDDMVGPAVLTLVIEAGREKDEIIGRRRSLHIGFVGLGNVFGAFVSTIFAYSEALSRWRSGYAQVSLSINDIHTPPRGIVKDLQKRLYQVGIILLREPLDELLSTCDVVVVAVHRGPSADPLLGAKEAELLRPHSWVIDVSEAGVVDPSAFDPIELRGPLPTYIRVDEVPASQWEERIGADLVQPAKVLAKFIDWNLREFDKSRRVREVEHVNC